VQDHDEAPQAVFEAKLSGGAGQQQTAQLVQLPPLLALGVGDQGLLQRLVDGVQRRVHGLFVDQTVESPAIRSRRLLASIFLGATTPAPEATRDSRWPECGKLLAMDLPSNPPVSPAVRITVLLRLASEGFQDAFGTRPEWLEAPPVDLAELREVVDQTVAPTRTSLWLRPTAGARPSR